MDELVNLIRKVKISNEDIDSIEEDTVQENFKINHSDKMSVENINNLINCLKLPDSIRDLPKFEGSKHTLHEFIDNVNEIIEQCETVLGKDKIPKTFLRAIRNKIINEADEILNMYGTPLDWNSIKQNLTTHYADKRNEVSLIRDLHTLHQGNDTIERFFSKIIDIQSTMINNIKLNENNLTALAIKDTLYKEMCLATFLVGIKEPMGPMIRARDPKNIADAFSLCITEQNMHYIKTKPNYIPQNSQRKMVYNIPPSNPHFQRLYNQPFQPKPNVSLPHNEYYNHKPFKNNFSTQFRNNFQYNKPPALLPPKPQPKPEPMDTTSVSNKYKQHTANQGNPYNNNYKPNQGYQPRQVSQPTPRFISQELFNLDNPEIVYPDSDLQEETPQDQNYFPNLDIEYEDESHSPEINEIDDADFLIPASIKPSGS